jgi:hypothetical protein
MTKPKLGDKKFRVILFPSLLMKFLLLCCAYQRGAVAPAVLAYKFMWLIEGSSGASRSLDIWKDADQPLFQAFLQYLNFFHPIDDFVAARPPFT